jgi:hypothetical protein
VKRNFRVQLKDNSRYAIPDRYSLWRMKQARNSLTSIIHIIMRSLPSLWSCRRMSYRQQNLVWTFKLKNPSFQALRTVADSAGVIRKTSLHQMNGPRVAAGYLGWWHLWTYVHSAYVYAEDIDRMNIYDGTEVY